MEKEEINVENCKIAEIKSMIISLNQWHKKNQIYSDSV